MKVYLIPGLGFDHRIFEKLDLREIEFDYLNWIEPRENESIKAYAIRLSNRIGNSNEKVVLIGHSFGGIVAREIAAIRPIEKIILISSIKARQELPFHFKIVKPLFIHKLFTKELTVKTIKYWGKTHDYETEEEQGLMKDMVTKQTNHLLQWSLRHLSSWKEPEIESTAKIFQIHGELDKTFPIKLIKQPDEIIRKAGHFMVFKHSKLISEKIEAFLVK